MAQMSYAAAGAIPPGPNTPRGYVNDKAIWDHIFAVYNALDVDVTTNATAGAVASRLVRRDGAKGASFGYVAATPAVGDAVSTFYYGQLPATSSTHNFFNFQSSAGANLLRADYTGYLWGAGIAATASSATQVPVKATASSATAQRLWEGWDAGAGAANSWIDSKGAASFASVAATTFTGALVGTASSVASAPFAALADGRPSAATPPNTTVALAAEWMQTTGGQPFLAPAASYDFAGHYPASGFVQAVVLCRDTTTAAGTIQAVSGAGVAGALPGTVPAIPAVTTAGWVPRAVVYIQGGGAAITGTPGGAQNWVQDVRGPGTGGAGAGAGAATTATVRSSATSATLAQVLANGVSDSFYRQLYDAGGGVLGLAASAAATGSPAQVAAIIGGELRVNTAPAAAPAIAIPGTATVYSVVGDASAAGPGFAIALQPAAATTLTPQQAILAKVVYDPTLGGFVVGSANPAVGRAALPVVGSANLRPLTFYTSWTGGVLTGLLALCPGSPTQGVDFVEQMRGEIRFYAEVTQGAVTAQQGKFLLQVNGGGSASTGNFVEQVVMRPGAATNQLESVSGVFNLDAIPVGPGRVTFGLVFSASVYGGTGNVSGAADNLKIQNAWLAGRFWL